MAQFAAMKTPKIKGRILKQPLMGEMSMIGSMFLLVLIIVAIATLYGYFSMPDR